MSVDWEWFARPEALTLGVWALAAVSAVAILTEWVKAAVRLAARRYGIASARAHEAVEDFAWPPVPTSSWPTPVSDRFDVWDMPGGDRR